MKNIAIITGASSGIGKEFLLNMPKNIEVDEIWAINSEKLKVYSGNYDLYINQRKKEEEKQNHTYEFQQRQIKRLKQEVVKRKQRAYRLKKGNGKKMTNSEKKAAGRTEYTNAGPGRCAGA